MASGDDDSEFYGEEELVQHLDQRVQSLDVEQWWKDRGDVITPLKVQASSAMNETCHLHNPYSGQRNAWQLTETVDAFLNRLPPKTTDESDGGPWIWVANPYVKQKPKREAQNQHIRGGEHEAPESDGADLQTFMTAGQERLDFASSFNNECRAMGQSSAFITREIRKAGLDAANDILVLARNLRITCGKWMIFSEAAQINDIWEVVVKATVDNQLGIAAKVATRSDTDDRRERLICIYTADFSDKPDVTRVAKSLKQLGLANKTLYYKPDCFTYLGIASGNPWQIKASIYDSRNLAG
ncbi:DUF1917-domain-containing protein [Xylariaceae sp. FL0255]|nr:DUF1917-domain-containing protein [Xylariaceae sp. FL0255]